MVGYCDEEGAWTGGVDGMVGCWSGRWSRELDPSQDFRGIIPH